MKNTNSSGSRLLWLFTTVVFVFFSSSIAFSAQPGIDSDRWGITTWTGNSSSPYTSLESWVRIVDYDGIADDGSSHTVTVTYPDASVHTLYFSSKTDDHTAYYELFDSSIPQPVSAATYSGTYTYRVVDSIGEWSEFTEDLVVNTINPPDETTFLPNFSTVETLTAYFDDVYVNGSLWDDFNSGYNPSKWNYPPSGVTYENGQVRFEKTYYTPSGSVAFQLKNEPALNEFKATVRADSIIGVSSKARIMGRFWRESDADVTCQLRLQENEATYNIIKDHILDGHLVYDYDDFTGVSSLGSITQGNRYELSMQWNGVTITFHVLGLDDSVDYSANYTPSGTVITASDPGATLSLARHLVLEDTTTDLNWAAVPGAAFYRVRFYAYNQNWQQFKIFTGYTTDTTYTVPPGILKPNGYYRYRIEAVREHQWIDVDNRSVSDQNLEFIVTGPQESQDPFIDLWSSGVGTWTSDLFGGNTHTDFYIKVHDAQGVPGDIASVKVLFPDAVTEVSLYRDYNESATCAIYRANYFGPVQSGDYTFTVLDRDGHSYSTHEILTPNPISAPVETTLVPANNAVIGGTAVSFDWDDVPGAAFYQVKIYDKNFNQIYDLYTTDSEYALGPGMLAENSLYRYRVYARREFFEQNADNGSATPFTLELARCFFTTQTNGTSTPSIDLDSFGAAVLQAPHPGTGAPVYVLEFLAHVTDADGVPENIQKVEVTYPDGITTRLLNYMNDEGSNYEYFEFYDDPEMIPVGTYTFKAVDFEGNEVILQDTLDNVSTNIIPWVGNLNPADGTVLTNTIPLITWDPVPGAAYYKVRILGSWGLTTIHWSNELTQTQYSVPQGVLEPNTTYSYRVYAYREPIGDEVDFLSCNNLTYPTNYHFTTGGPCDCDLNNDGKCDMQDWLLFGQNWGATNCNDPGVNCDCDLNNDGNCDMQDWLLFGNDWGRTDCPVRPE